MNVSKLRSSTAIDRAFGISAASAAPKKSTKINDGSPEAQSDRAAQSAPSVGLTADAVSMYLQGISANSCDGIDALIGGLHGLRQRLVSDSDRIKQNIVEFAGLNQSVIELTRIVSDGVVHIRAPNSVTEAS
jgi:hypothetical protein